MFVEARDRQDVERRRVRMRVFRSAAVIALAGAITAIGPSSGSAAPANSDPASHVLPLRDVFPHTEWQGLSGLLLRAAVDRVYDAGDRIKVAVIAQAVELGGMGALWNQPSRYARYLAEQQLRPVFLGPILIVMPSGFGIYDGGRSTAAERRVLARLRVGGSSSDVLTASAATAVLRLHAAGALRSKDVLAPRAAMYAAYGARGELMKLYYTLQDDSDRAGAAVWVAAGRSRVATFRLPLRRLYRQVASFAIDWRVPRQLPRGEKRACLAARDASGNASATTCAALTIR